MLKEKNNARSADFGTRMKNKINQAEKLAYFED